MASTSNSRNEQKPAYKIMSWCFFAIALICGFSSVYPIYSAYQLLDQQTNVVTSPLSNLLLASLLLSIAYCAGQAYERIEHIIMCSREEQT